MASWTRFTSRQAAWRRACLQAVAKHDVVAGPDGKKDADGEQAGGGLGRIQHPLPVRTHLVHLQGGEGRHVVRCMLGSKNGV